jgi:hypothetical protein
MTLNLQTYEPLPTSAPVQPELRRSPVLAMLLSLLLPGLGHLYLKSWRIAGWIIGAEFLALLIVAGGNGQLHAAAIITVPALYLFAIIDAYFRAREWNAGVTDWMIRANPRITAILNLLTKGFGYFYLGDRVKGILCFFGMSAAQGVLLLHTNIWTRVLAISLQVAVALDGYRVARERLLAEHPELRSLPNPDEASTTNLIDAANPGIFKPAIATTFFAAVGTAILIVYAALQAMNGHTTKSNGTLEEGPTGLIYRNPQAGIELTVPGEWQSAGSQDTMVFLRDDGVSLLIQEPFATYSVGSMLDETQKDLLRRFKTATFVPSGTTLAGRWASGFEASYNNTNDVEIHQRVFGLRRGLKILVLIETWTRPEKRPVFDQIEQSIRLQ